MEYHKSVLLEEVIAHLKVSKGKKYIDATLGDGGHTLEILKSGGVVLGIDYDKKTLERAQKRIEKEKLAENFKGILGNFKDIDELAEINGYKTVNGILFDLGYSSTQLKSDEYGLSFELKSPLDMRLDKTMGVTAADIVNSLPEKELAEIIYNYSGEKFAKKIAKRIVETRKLKKFQSTKDLSRLIVDVTPPGYEQGRLHPATRTFQALRILVNDELGNLERSLPRAARLLLPGGRMIVISFHSLEDRIVKQFGRGAQPHIKTVNKKPIRPSEKEVKNNPQARSARMRVFEKI